MAMHVFSFIIKNNKVTTEKSLSIYKNDAPKRHIGLQLFKDEVSKVKYNKPGIYELSSFTGERYAYIILRDRSRNEVIDTHKFWKRFKEMVNLVPEELNVPNLTRVVNSILSNNEMLIDKDALQSGHIRSICKKYQAAVYKKLIRLYKDDDNQLNHIVVGSEDYKTDIDLKDEDNSIFTAFSFVAQLPDMLSDNYIMVYKYSKTDRNPIVYICLEDKYRRRLNKVLDGLKASSFYNQFCNEKMYTYMKLTEDDINDMLAYKLSLR